MDTQTVTLRLPQNLLTRASTVAQQQDVTIGHLVRHLLRKEVDRRLNTKRSAPASGQLVAALQALLAAHMARADCWASLSFSLAEEGYELRPAGGGLTLHRRPCGTRLCKASEIGFPYRALVKRFRSGMPGHPHGALNLTFDRLLPEQDSLPLDPAAEAPFDVIDYDA